VSDTTHRPADNSQFQPHIPAAVRRASQQADELAREAGVANMPPLAEPSPEVTTVVADRPAEDRPPEERPEHAPAPAPTPVPEPSSDWEQRYNTLQGKYNTELPELRGQVRSLQELLAAMQSAPRAELPPAIPDQPKPRVNIREIPSEDVEAYGQELINASQRWAEARFAPLLQDYERRIAAVEGGTQQMAQISAQRNVEQQLAHAVPNWEQVNTDPAFLTWLAQVDPFSGRSRKAMITEAHGAGDAARTIAFFRAYLNEHTAVSPTPGTRLDHTDAQASADRLPLESLAVPGRGQVAAPAASGAPEKRIWTTAQITAFYREKQRGMWRDREADADRVERDIIAASKEGRVRQ
jgi:hypothetical protein